MCIERSLSEPSDGFEDLVGGFRPLERLWFVVVGIEVVVYGRFGADGTLVCEPRRKACSVSKPKKRSDKVQP